ncbi:DUF4235 domain-containing protein [uncultured Nocardioides sp.]|uniref:DUF4235 domain-containing protein n=1 Tax=uncultured Nocardioides sp. TaxID=198441 RepID=UPI00260BF968|nr:DUF4235 domain-containing protein [uncultured Nocardioides sp.]
MAKDEKSSKIYSAFALVSALSAAMVAKKTLETAWRTATGKNPPANPADPDVQLWEAVMWAAASGTVVQISRMLAARKAAGYYVKSTGKLPPELQGDSQDASKASPATT